MAEATYKSHVVAELERKLGDFDAGDRSPKLKEIVEVVQQQEIANSGLYEGEWDLASNQPHGLGTKVF